MDKIAKIITGKAEELFEETIRLRRHFHTYPELSFKEYRTAEYISDYLDRHKIKHQKNLAGTGIAGWIEGKGDGRTVALRAEMDALPIYENTGVDYASANEGLMHACGHDAHMAMLLSSLLIVKDNVNNFGGRVAFIFQPGEELAPGGARLIIETPFFKELKPDLIIAQHVLPDLETGMTGFRAGNYMASSDEIHIKIVGKGGHAALPDKYTDQVKIGSELVLKLKEILNDYPPDEPLVLGIGQFNAAGNTNIIPEEVHIKGTVRTFNNEIRKDIKKKVSDVCNYIRNKYGIEIHLDLPDGYPVLNNSPWHTRRSAELAAEINGAEGVTGIEPRMSSEDFAFYSQKYPSVFYRLGIKGRGKGINGLHTQDFNLDERAMVTGIKTLSYLGMKFTEKG